MQKNESLLLVDLGTSSIRVFQVDFDGKIRWQSQKPYKPDYIDEVHIEQDPEIWFNYLDEILQHTDDEAHEPEGIRGVVLTAQRSSVIPVDAEGRALRPALMWQDRRHAELCEQLKKDYPDIQKITGAMINTAYSGPKMLWLKQNEPEIYEKAYRLLTPAEFLIFRLTGKSLTDQTYASRSLLFDIKKLDWSEDILNAWGIDREKLSDIVPPSSVMGKILPKWTRRWQLPEGTPLISAGGDQQCSALGLGVVKEGDFEMTAGTGGYVMTLSQKLPERYEGCAVNVSAIPGYYVYETTMLACSSAFDFFCRLLYPEHSLKEIDREMEEVPIGSNGIVVLPFFQGSGSPEWSPARKADLMGLSFSASAAEISFACLEAIACELADHVALLENVTGEKAKRISIAGGLTHNARFRTAVAALLEAEVLRPAGFESGIYGAYMSACVRLGRDESYPAAMARVNQLFKEEKVQAEAKASEAYAEVLARYRAAKAEKHITNRRA